MMAATAVEAVMSQMHSTAFRRLIPRATSRWLN
jgi:hypothetical protein